VSGRIALQASVAVGNSGHHLHTHLQGAVDDLGVAVGSNDQTSARACVRRTASRSQYGTCSNEQF